MASGSGIETNRIHKFVEMERGMNWFPGACTKCHKIPSEDNRMKACSKCRLVRYCGKECQTKDWKYHRDFCKAASTVAVEICGPGSYLFDAAKEEVGVGKDFYDYCLHSTALIRMKLNRPINALEVQIIFLSKVCEICKDNNLANLKSCKICYMVFYCSEKHAKQDAVRHRKFCPENALFLQCYSLGTTKGYPIPGTMPFNIPIVNEYKRMSGSMKDYIRPTFEPAIDACLSEWVSYPLSLLFALEHTGLNDGTIKINDMEELTVLMFDAFNGILRTMVNCYTWEYLLHLLPKLKKLNVILYESDKSDEGDYGSHDIKLCSDCIIRECKLTQIFIGDYPRYRKSNLYKKPDVIYNHRVTNNDEKEICLPYPEPKVPLVLIDEDKHKMEKGFNELRKKEKINILLPLQLNPFCGMKPMRANVDYMENGSFLHYTNCYIVVLRRQVKENVKLFALPI